MDSDVEVGASAAVLLIEQRGRDVGSALAFAVALDASSGLAKGGMTLENMQSVVQHAAVIYLSQFEGRCCVDSVSVTGGAYIVLVDVRVDRAPRSVLERGATRRFLQCLSAALGRWLPSSIEVTVQASFVDQRVAGRRELERGDW